jgi:pentatricopeptide repeat protein
MANKEKLEKAYLRIIEWGTYAILFTPLIFFQTYFFPFVSPKTIFFRIVVDIIFAAYLLLVIANPRYRPKLSPLTIAVSVFLGALVLTSITGVNFERSFWSVFERMSGLLTFFHLFAFYLVLSSVFKERQQWEKILSVSILAGILVSFYALLSQEVITRGGGTLGNSSFLSAYILFNLFFALILLISKQGLWRIFYGSALLVFLASLFFNPLGFTKGAVSALGIGAVFFVIGYMFFSKNRLLKRSAPAVLILLVLLGVFIVKDFYFQDRPFDLREIPDRSRQIVWKIGWQAWQERFWLGWGLENFNIPFIKHYDPELPITGDVWYDRVHNIVLDTAVSSGVVGLLSYLAIFGTALWGLLKLLPEVSDKKNLAVPLGMISLLLVYFLQNLWVFDMISSYLAFFLSLAFINFLLSPREKENKQKAVSLSSFSGGLLMVLAIFALFVNIQSVRASKLIFQGITYPLEQAIPAFQKAFQISPMVKFEGPEQFSMRINSLSSQSNQNRQLLQEGFELAEQEFKNSIADNPLDFRFRLFLGRHCNYSYHFSGNKEKLALAEESLEQAFELGPDNQQVYFILAQTRFLQGRDEEALALLRKVRDLEPRFAGAGWYLFKGYNLAGKYEEALALLKEMENYGLNWQDNAETLKEVIDLFKKTGETLEVMIPLYEKGVELDPQDLYLWEDLINSYIEAGDREGAKTAAERFGEIRPEFAPQVEQLLKDLGY